MKEWVLANTDISEEEYDNKITQYQNLPFIKGYAKDYRSLLLINIITFTLYKPTNETMNKYHIIPENDMYRVKDTKVIFSLFYDFCPAPELFTINRTGHCFSVAIELGSSEKVSIVTSICKDYNNRDFLHTFVISEQEEPWVFDYSLNLIMPKTTYYELLNVREIKVLNNADFRHYYKILRNNISKVSGQINEDEFLVFPESITNALKK